MRLSCGLLMALLFASPGVMAQAQDVVTAATALRLEGRAEEAEAMLRPLLPSDDPAVLAALAEALADQDKTEEAVKLYERVVELRPDDEVARTRLAVLLTYCGRLSDALARYQELHALHPSDPTLNLAIAELLVDMDRSAESVPYFEAYLAAVPDDQDVLRKLYHVYEWNNQPKKALAVLEHLAMELDASMLAELAERYVEAERARDAMAVFERILAEDPHNLVALKGLGQLYEWENRPEDALPMYEAYLERVPMDMAVRERATRVALDLGLGRVARGLARGLEGERFKGLKSEAAFLDSGPKGTFVSADYAWVTNNQRFSHHAVGPAAGYGLSRHVTLGGLYRFHHLFGPDVNKQDHTMLAHEGGIFAESLLPLEIRLDGGASVTAYDTGWTSFNAYAELGRTFGPVVLALRGERRDLLTTAGDVLARVVANGVALRAYAEPWWKLFATGGFEYDRYSDSNNRLYGEAAVGVVALSRPRVEVSYTYSIEHFTDTSPGRSYFNPSAYHTHGPMVAIEHPVVPYFQYGADIRLWHAVSEDALFLTYGASVAFRVAWKHLLRVAFHRTDTVYGTTKSLYNENLLTAGYVFEF